jgi:ABC-type uncharacterized transport system substrate-binding protein
VRLGPDVIVAQTAAAIRVLQQQTQTIPIVITGAGDVSTNGIVKIVAHPEGNVTGVTNAVVLDWWQVGGVAEGGYSSRSAHCRI